MNHKNTTEIFTEVYNQTYSEAYGYILAVTGDAKNATKWLKECYIALFSRIKKSKKTEVDFRQTLFKIIRTQLQKKNKDISESDIPKPTRIKKYNEFIQSELETEFDPPKNQNELIDMLDTALTHVSEKSTIQRQCFLLYYLYDFSIEQIAQKLNISEMSAGNFIHEITLEIRTVFQTKKLKNRG